jgi:hypothetical protein
LGLKILTRGGNAMSSKTKYHVPADHPSGENPGGGHFYLAKNRTFLLCADIFV